MKKIKSKIKKFGSRGQTAVEYLLVLASAAGLLMMFGIYFHKKIIGRFFQILGMIIG